MLIVGFFNKDIIIFLMNGKYDKVYVVLILIISYYYVFLLYYDNIVLFYVDIFNLICWYYDIWYCMLFFGILIIIKKVIFLK